MFQSARLKLTFWYALISLLISLMFSVALFFVLHGELVQSIRRREIFEDRMVLIQEIDDVGNRLKVDLIYINLSILAISSFAGYFLAGRVLDPIKKMVEKQNRFVTDASHELRTPLTALKTAIEVNIRDRKLNLSQAKTVLKENLSDVNRLKKLSDSLLSLTRIENINYKLKKVSLKNVLEKSIKKAYYFAKIKNITIKSSLKEIEVLGDEEQLSELFLIFLDNAVKYSPKNTEISVSLNSNNSWVEIRIGDQGIGIKKKDLPFIFDRFYRADKSRSSNKVEGYGLGLSIAKEIVTFYKGRINVESALGKGTTFSIFFPIV